MRYFEDSQTTIKNKFRQELISLSLIVILVIACTWFFINSTIISIVITLFMCLFFYVALCEIIDHHYGL